MSATLRRLLEESMSALEQDQLPPHRTAELSAIKSEIEARRTAVQHILRLHKVAGQRFIKKVQSEEAPLLEDSMDVNDSADNDITEEDLDESFFDSDTTIGRKPNQYAWLTDLPKVALLVHISEIQQLHRGLCIYRYERHKMLVRCALECARRGITTVGATLASRLSAEESTVLSAMLADPHLHSLSYGTTCHPTQEDTVKDMRGLYVAEDVGHDPPSTAAAENYCTKFFSALHENSNGQRPTNLFNFMNI